MFNRRVLIIHKTLSEFTFLTVLDALKNERKSLQIQGQLRFKAHFVKEEKKLALTIKYIPYHSDLP